MTTYLYQRLKLAYYILARLERRSAHSPDSYVQETRELFQLSQDLHQASLRLATCYRKGWKTAALLDSQALCRMTSELTSRYSHLSMLTPSFKQTTVPLLRDVFADIRQLDDEFDAVKINLREHTLSVTLEPVILDGITLGSFRITLDLKELPNLEHKSTYRVIALEPNPASSNDNVTHPHVRDEELCEGEAAAGIKNALSAGRVCDFFMLVRSVLQNYNAGSPYVTLDDWEGTACTDCGAVVSDDDRFYCEGCEKDFCDNCISCCRGCSESRCPSCLDSCETCNKALCHTCQATCEGCLKTSCDDCLEDSLCPACREKETTHDDAHDNATNCSADRAADSANPAADAPAGDATLSSNGEAEESITPSHAA